MFTLDFINTVALGGVVLFVVFGVRRLLPWLVGAFFIEFVNAVVIAVCLNIWT